MRVKSSLLLLLFVFAVEAVVAPASYGQISDPHPVTTAQLVAWLTGGISSSRLAQVVDERGLATLPTHAELRQLESAGAGKDLMHVAGSGNVQSAHVGPVIPEALLKAAADAKQQRYHEAEIELRGVVAADVQNTAPHFALGEMLRQQEQWDDAYDELEAAVRLMPELPENHSALAYLFYRLDDGPNAIAEARTALSIDPKNAEAYQYLGLGLYSLGDYSAAVHAYSESLTRDRDNADTYYDMGIALHAAGNLPRAIVAYEQAIRLRPAFWEAHSNLGLILHEEGNLLAKPPREYREAKRIAPQEASVRNNLGNTYCDQGKFDAAIEEMKELYRSIRSGNRDTLVSPAPTWRRTNYGAAVDELRLAVRRILTGGRAPHPRPGLAARQSARGSVARTAYRRFAQS